jgi:hypothetical protein
MELIDHLERAKHRRGDCVYLADVFPCHPDRRLYIEKRMRSLFVEMRFITLSPFVPISARREAPR